MDKASTLLLLLQFLLFSFLYLASGAAPVTDRHCITQQDHGSDLRIIHAYGPCSPFRPASSLSWVETLLGLTTNDESRLLYLSSLLVAPARKSIVPIASGRQILQSANYVVRARIGTPPQTMLLAVDTSNDAAWIPCSACVGCPSSTLFSPALSSTYKPLPCQSPQCKQVPNPTCEGARCAFNMTYGGSTFQAALVQESVALAADVIPSYAFGCLEKVTGNTVPPQGLLGLGRGPMSLMSQTHSLYFSTFSYCLPSFKSLNFSGSLRLGLEGQPFDIKYTPLLASPRRPSLYYVRLTGIRVGRRLVNIPPSALAFDPPTGAGTIFDSGTMFTRLVAPAYIAVRDEFRRRVKGTVSTLGGFDTCYNGPIVAPRITLEFTGMNMTLPADNVLIHSTAGSITCLAMAAVPDNVNSVLNVIANFQQQNHRVLFDVPNGRIAVARELCT